MKETPTYRQVIAEVQRRTGRTVKTCWIAEVKNEMGLPTRPAWNRGRGQGSPPCPVDLKPEIRLCFELGKAG